MRVGLNFLVLVGLGFALLGCSSDEASDTPAPIKAAEQGAADYYNLRPEVEKAYGYSHGVKIGNIVKISGAVSMDGAGNPTAAGDLEQQMKNVYVDLGKVLAHYGYTFDDVIEENIFTTDMKQFLTLAGYRTQLYTNHFPTGTWLEVKGLALPEFMIEIEIEAYKAP